MTDPAFVRAWRLYLAGPMASFTASELQLFQVAFVPAACSDRPWTRWHIYRDAHDREHKRHGIL
ncbi:MAG: hypothetical protein MZV65_52310 [Chromatiales bacterium]|nr:hypothetical protein [Chromatiales bacterium]